jgi:hypothetical protein
MYNKLNVFKCKISSVLQTENITMIDVVNIPSSFKSLIQTRNATTHKIASILNNFSKILFKNKRGGKTRESLEEI